MLKIRLARGGRTGLPYYRILVTNATSPRDSKFLEKIGTYNPLLADDKENRVTVNKERAEYWLSVGAQPTEKVAKFLIALGVKGADKYTPNFEPKAKGSNLKKKAAAKVAKEKEAADAIIAEAAAAKAASEAPVEVPAEAPATEAVA
jgi:small subunit ribosomal protein S16